MYSTCTFCHAPLGANEALEHFPVGRRVAFDAAKGRLWAVCGVCRQWNLSPLEERWEAIEEAERWYRDTGLRVATDQIGLARLRDGAELIRIGQPLRPEFAAWRYGERFEARWRKSLAWGIAGGAMLTGYIAAGPVMGLIAGGVGSLPINVYQLGHAMYAAKRVAGRFEDAEGPFVVTRSQVGASRIITDPASSLGWSLSVRRVRADVLVGRLGPSAGLRDARSIIAGPAALDAARTFLPMLNSSGGRRSTVDEAVKILERRKSPESTFLLATKKSGRNEMGDPSWELAALPTEIRLALEMAAHEETERRALEGELATLEAAWREAEEIAAIADSLTLPERVIKRLERIVDGR